MNVSIDKKKEEALKRMKAWNLDKAVIDAFIKGGKNSLYYSERVSKNMPAILYWVNNKEDLTRYVNEFEEKYNALVYHCVLTHTNFGDIFDMLYVSDYEEEWHMDNADINQGYAISNSKNLTDDTSSEIGTIHLRHVIGGLERIG